MDRTDAGVDGMSASEKEANAKAALKHFGKTYSWKETGYLTTKGEKIDFSGRHEGGPGGYRTVDHRDISDALGDGYGGDSYSGAMVQFMAEGNIRISPESGGINLAVKPTKAQETALSDFISRERGEVILDIDKPGGDTIISVEYPRGTYSSKVINDIRRYFETGEEPVVSELSRFHYSRDNPTVAALQRENTLLKERLEYWKGQTKLTERTTVRLRDVDKVAKNTLAEYQSKAEFGKVRNEMKVLADDMCNVGTSWNSLHSKAQAIAETILDGSQAVTNEETVGIVKDIRAAIKGTKIALGEAKADIADFNDFRKRNFGRLIFSDSGTPMDVVWLDLQDQFGKGFFPEEITHPADQVLHLEQLLRMTPEYGNPYQTDYRNNMETLTNEILDDLFSDSVRATAPTFADRKAQRIQELNGKIQESRDTIKALREDKKQLRKQYQDSRAKSVDGRKKTVLRNQIKDMADRFHQMATAPQKANTRHAPIRLTNALYQFCDLFAESQERGLERKSGELKQRQENLNAYLSDHGPTKTSTMEAERIPRAEEWIAQTAKKLKAMRDAYADLEKEGNGIYYDAHTAKLVEQLNGELSGTDIYDMNREQLEAVRDTMKSMMHAIVNANNVASMEKDMGLTEVVKKFQREIDQASVRYGDTAVALRRYKIWQMSPDTFFNYICGYVKDNAGKAVQKMFSRGSERMITVQRDFYNLFRPFTESTNKQDAKELRDMRENPMKHTVDWGLKDRAGNTVETSRGMMLQAYMLLKQEDSLNAIAAGGFKIPRMDAYYKGNIDAAYGDIQESELYGAGLGDSALEIDREIKKLKGDLKTEGLEETDSREMKARLQELEKQLSSMVAGEKTRLIDMRDSIYEEMTPMERKLIETADQWYRHSGKLMGDVYEGMYGYRPHLVDDYVPIHRDLDSVKMDVRDVDGAFNLEESGFTKERVKSTAPVLLTDFFTELSGQSDAISRYYGFAQVQKDFNRIWNMKVPGTTMTVKGKVGAKFGKGKTLLGVSGEMYVENYIKAVSGANQGNDLLNKLYGNAASATLSLNPRVAFSQLASIPTASAVVGWKSMAVGFAKGIRTSLSTERKNDLAQKSVWFFQRYRGSGGITEIAELNARGGVWEKVSSSRVGKAFFNWCQSFDVFATASMWAMAEDYVQSQGMKVDAEGYQAAVEQAYADIIRKTQPNYTVTERSDLLRDKRGGMKLLTMYKTQSNQNMNILMDANGEYRRMRQDLKNGRNGVTEADVKAAGKRLSNAVTSVTIGGTLTFVALRTMVNFLMGAVNPYRDDDTDEVTLEETLKSMGKEMLSSLSGMFALGGQVYDLVSSLVFKENYYGISDSAISLIVDATENTVKALTKLFDADADSKAKWAQMEKGLAAILTAAGVPYNNAKKFVNAAKQWYQDFENGTPFQYSREKTTDNQYRERFLKAFRDGDRETCGDVMAYLLVKSEASSDYEAEKTLRSGFQNFLKDKFVDEEVSEEEVKSILHGYLDMDEEDVEDALMAWQGIVDTGNTLTQENDLYLRKKITKAQYAEYLVKYDGKKQDEADNYIKKVDFEQEYEFPYSDRKEGYKDGKITSSQLVQAMVDIDGKSRTEAQHTIAEYDWENSVPNSEGITWSAIQEYQEKAAPMGISKSLYTKGWKIRNKTKGDDLDGDGKTDKDSKAIKVIRQIGQMSISAEEKQALALVWWSEKTVNKYKTW